MPTLKTENCISFHFISFGCCCCCCFASSSSIHIKQRVSRTCISKLLVSSSIYSCRGHSLVYPVCLCLYCVCIVLYCVCVCVCFFCQGMDGATSNNNNSNNNDSKESKSDSFKDRGNKYYAQVRLFLFVFFSCYCYCYCYLTVVLWAFSSDLSSIIKNRSTGSILSKACSSGIAVGMGRDKNFRDQPLSCVRLALKVCKIAFL